MLVRISKVQFESYINMKNPCGVSQCFTPVQALFLIAGLGRETRKNRLEGDRENVTGRLKKITMTYLDFFFP